VRVYLDQWVWISLAQQHWGKRDTVDGRAALDAVMEARDAGVEFPLSGVHYRETYRRVNVESRDRLARFMVAVSRLHSLACLSSVTPPELDLALQSRFGKPRRPRRLQVHGRGVRHIFRDLGAYEEIMRIHASTGAPLDYIEYMILSGPDYDDPDNKSVRPDYRFSSKTREAEEDLARRWEGIPDDLRERAVSATQLLDIKDELDNALALAEIPLDEFLSIKGEQGEGLAEFLESIPTIDVLMAIRRGAHRAVGRKWSDTDQDDFAALAVAVSYCDVVVGEHRWIHLLRAAGIDNKYETTLVSRLKELPVVLAA
jgi:hypothetical protein